MIDLLISLVTAYIGFLLIGSIIVGIVIAYTFIKDRY